VLLSNSQPETTRLIENHLLEPISLSPLYFKNSQK
jgi:hypothetical protein